MSLGKNSGTAISSLTEPCSRSFFPNRPALLWESVFVEMFRSHWAPVAAYCARLVRDRGAGPDLCQEAFCRAWRMLGRLQPPYRLLSLVFEIARRVCREHVRRLAAADHKAKELAKRGRQFAVNDPREVCEREEALGRALAAAPGFARYFRRLKAKEGLSLEEAVKSAAGSSRLWNGWSKKMRDQARLRKMWRRAAA